MSAVSQAKSWYLVQIKPNSHKIAARNLERQGFAIFMPQVEQTKRKRGKFLNGFAPLFPGYMFVSFNSNEHGWTSIKSTYGVSKLVSFGKGPTPVPNELIENLKLRCSNDQVLLPPEAFKPGDVVEFISGPFAEFIATIEKIAPDQRVWVLMDIMGGKKQIQTKTDNLRLV